MKATFENIPCAFRNLFILDLLNGLIKTVLLALMYRVLWFVSTCTKSIDEGKNLPGNWYGVTLPHSKVLWDGSYCSVGYVETSGLSGPALALV